MKLADLFNEDNRYKTAMAMSGLGSVLQGNSAAPMMRNMMMLDMQKKESEQERQEKERQRQAQRQAQQQGNQSLRGLFGGGGQTPGGFNPAEPVSLPNENQMIGAETMAALGTENYTPGDKESFVKAMMPHAMRVSQQTGLDPRLVIAQAAQETGWGRSAPNNNFFGIKSHGQANGARLSTRESIDGQNVRIQDNFRQYGGMGESADDYARFLQNNPRYQEMLSAPDLQSQVQALGQSGYATDPNYAQSVGSIAQSIGAPTGDRRMAQAGGNTRTDAIDPARAMMILNNPNVSDQAKSYIVDRLKKQNIGGITGRDRYMNVGGQLFDVTGDRPRAVTERQVEMSAKEEEIERLMSTQNISRERATAIADNVIRVNRDPTTERIQITNVATNETWEPRSMEAGGAPQGRGQPQQPPQGQPQGQPDQQLGAGDERFGTPYQQGNEVFGVGGMLRRGANAVSDAVTGNPAFPEASQTQRDYDVLREDLTQDMQSAYGQRVPSWALQAIRDLTPAAGTFEGAGAAQDKLQALGRRFQQELQGVEQTLGSGAQRRMSPADIDALRSQASGLRGALGKIDSALQGFESEISDDDREFMRSLGLEVD